MNDQRVNLFNGNNNKNITTNSSRTIQNSRTETNNRYNNLCNNSSNYLSNNNAVQHQINPNTLKLFRSNSNMSNISNSGLINNINYLNECFLNKNIENEMINQDWRNIPISSLISQEKLLSTNAEEIMYKGYLNKLVISHMFKNCSTSVEKFSILTKDKLSIYKNKENFLLMAKAQHSFYLTEILNCRRIDFSYLKIPKLEGFYFMYIELERVTTTKEDNEDLIYNIIKREKEGKFFVMFSSKENLVNEWVTTINYFREIQNSSKG